MQTGAQPLPTASAVAVSPSPPSDRFKNDDFPSKIHLFYYSQAGQCTRNSHATSWEERATQVEKDSSPGSFALSTSPKTRKQPLLYGVQKTKKIPF